MSDYGFATYDKGGKRRTGSVNSKWPIFGPRYADIKRAFRTIHFTDTYTQTYYNSPNVELPPANNYQEDMDRGSFRQLVATIPHGYGFRPLGYVSFSGSFSRNIRCKWDYVRAVDTRGNWAPSAVVTSYQNVTQGGISSFGGIIATLQQTSVVPPFSPNMFDVNYVDNVYPGLKNEWPSSSLYITLEAQTVQPYEAEIDENNIYIYRITYWVDKYGRWYRSESGQYGYTEDCRARSQGVVDWAGSEFDATIYLCPYRMEDLV